MWNSPVLYVIMRKGGSKKKKHEDKTPFSWFHAPIKNIVESLFKSLEKYFYFFNYDFFY